MQLNGTLLQLTFTASILYPSAPLNLLLTNLLLTVQTCMVSSSVCHSTFASSNSLFAFLKALVDKKLKLAIVFAGRLQFYHLFNVVWWLIASEMMRVQSRVCSIPEEIGQYDLIFIFVVVILSLRSYSTSPPLPLCLNFLINMPGGEK